MIFDAYAAYYDLLYKDKNYKEEAEYVHDLIKVHRPQTKTILDLGCGTGKHAFQFSKLGYEMSGVDISAKMIKIARSNYPLSNIHFYQGDLRDVRLNQKFDVVVALFHVMCYQTEDEDLSNALHTASSHLKDGGLLIFDCWYGPGVVNDPPVPRVKKMNNENIEVERFAQPFIFPSKKVVNVDYEVRIKEKRNESEHVINEKHRMRYLFRPEIEMMAHAAQLKIIALHEWLKFEKLDQDLCWNAAFVLKKI